ncbi:DUF6314 family protein [Herbaspirillum chlorophenolicum]|uniref:DUF6314 family protein n=1 Tax=Herbaspirillum chlorophenolicum TaxID=211589 RepID=UPI00067B9F62|nr:DUF6314 family protein [Herbaspirillum chlorophenolicum]
MDSLPDDSHSLFGFFRGDWCFKRTVWGAQDAPQAQAEGECAFMATEVEGKLLYREHGALHMLPLQLPGRPIPFTRAFEYLFGEEQVQVFFADGERVGVPYQQYVLKGNFLAPAAEHICGPDCYTAAYTLHGEGHFTMETFIRGPKKHSRLLTEYQRR